MMNKNSILAKMILAVAIIAGLYGVLPARATGTTYFVKWDAGGANTGASWANAFTDLQSAISAAQAGDEIWVAAGTYKPTTGIDRSISFTLKNNVAVFGGFAGIETVRSQRDFATNVTVLSGDIGSVGVNTDNSYHVVVSRSTNSATILDGFTITAGNANESSSAYYSGGGMYNDGGSPTLNDVIFIGNHARLGGGIYTQCAGDGCIVDLKLTNVFLRENTAIVRGGGIATSFLPSPSSTHHLSLTNVDFISNTANRTGGGMSNDGSKLTLMNVNFSGNSALGGGGLEHLPQNTSTLTNVTFNSNSVSEGGGGMLIGAEGHILTILTNVTFSNNSSTQFGGGIANERDSDLLLTNITFKDNSAITYGGGIANGGLQGTVSTGIVSLINTTFNNNSAGSNGGAVYNESGTINLHNSILYGNPGEEIYGSATVTNSIVQGGYAGTGNSDANPLLGPLQDNGGFTKTMALLPGSPAINAGDDAKCPTTDQRGVARPQGAHCDIGAYEYNTIIPTVTLTPSITPSPTFTRTPTTTTRPDLTITDMRIELQNTNCLQPGDPLGVRVWIANNGSIAASTFVVQVNGVKQSVNGLGAGDAKSLFFAGYSNPVTAIVDATGVIAESNENNNSVTQNVPVPTPPLPCTVTPTATQTPTVTATMTKSRTPSPTPTRLRPFMRSQFLTPASLTSDFGTTLGSLPSLGLLQQTGAEDDPAAYVSFQTPNTVYMGYQSFSLPSDARTDLIASMLLQVNFKGEASTLWTWSAYDWKSAQWIPLGNSIGAKAGMWKTLLFPIRTPWRFISSHGEIRIQLKSNNASGDAKVDYEALHLTYLSIPATVTPLPTSSYKKGAPFPPTSTP